MLISLNQGSRPDCARHRMSNIATNSNFDNQLLVMFIIVLILNVPFFVFERFVFENFRQIYKTVWFNIFDAEILYILM